MRETDQAGVESVSDFTKERRKMFIGAIVVILFTGLVLFGSSGNMGWVMAWVYLGVSLSAGLISQLVQFWVMERTKTIFEYVEFHVGDFILDILTALCILIAIPLVAGLDMRYGWSNVVPLVVPAFATALFLFSYLVILWANFTIASRSDMLSLVGGKHGIISGGPYRYIRHPGNLGIILNTVAVPLILGSYYALAPAFLTELILVVRTGLEDTALQKDLSGYKEYTQQVRYRLLPLVW